MTVECDWANSYSINKDGTLSDVLECTKCGRRKSNKIQKLPHLQNVSDNNYEKLQSLFKPRF